MPRPRSLLVAFAMCALVTSACSSNDVPPEAGASASSSASTPPSSASAPPSSATTTVPEPPDFAVGRLDVELVDASRPTAADPARDLPERPDRSLPVIVLYPAEGQPTDEGTAVADAPAFDGAFPLVVFSHGVTANGATYLGRLQRWARAGYVVAAPTFPRSSGPGGQIGDYVNQPADVHFVTRELVRRSEEPDHPLHGRVDGDRTAVAGHSLGAITTIGAAFNSCCIDEATDAAVEISGIELPFPDGSYDEWPETPLLAIHGANDSTVPVSGSERLVARSGSPTYYLRFPDAGHVDLLINERGDLIDHVVLAFFDRYLKDEPELLDEVPDAVDATGFATFETRGS